MFVILMLIALVLLSVHFAVIDQKKYADFSVRDIFVKSLLITGLVSYLFAEILSLLQAVNSSGIIVSWVLFDIFLLLPIIMGKVKVPHIVGHIRFRWKQLPYKWIIGILIFFLLVLLFLTLYVPLNNWDSMGMHVVRVYEWIQNKNIYPFPSFRVDQVSYTPGASYIALNIQLLHGSDRLNAMVQFLAMLGSVVTVSIIARQLKLDIKGQLLAIVLTASLPIGVLESTTTQVDYVSSFFLCSSLYFLLQLRYSPLETWRMIFLGITLGLGLLTKHVTLIFLFPFILWIGVGLLATQKAAEVIKLVSITTAIVAICFTSFCVRNYSVFGNITGPEKGSDFYIDYVNEKMSPAVGVANIAKTAGVQLATPLSSVNAGIYNCVDAVNRLVGFDGIDNAYNIFGRKYEINKNLIIVQNEDTAGNPLHLILLVVSFALFLIKYRHFENKKFIWLYYCCLLLSIFTYSVLFKWTAHNTRHLLSFYIAAIPLLAIVFNKIFSKSNSKGYILLCVILLGNMVFPIFMNGSKPIIPLGYYIKKKQNLMFASMTPKMVSSYIDTAPDTIKAIFNHIYEPDTVSGEYTLRVNAEPAKKESFFEYFDKRGAIDNFKGIFSKPLNRNNVDDDFYYSSRDAIAKAAQRVPDANIGLAVTSGLEYYYWKFAEDFYHKIPQIRFVYYPAFMDKVYNTSLGYTYQVIISDEPDFMRQLDAEDVEVTEKVGRVYVVIFKHPQQKVYHSSRKFLQN